MFNLEIHIREPVVLLFQSWSEVGPAQTVLETSRTLARAPDLKVPGSVRATFGKVIE